MPGFEDGEGKRFIRVPFTTARLDLTVGLVAAVKKAKEMMPKGLSGEDKAGAVDYFITIANMRMRQEWEDLTGFVDSLMDRDH